MPSSDASGTSSSSDAATLASAASMIEDLTARVVAVAERYVDSDREVVSHQLHEVERALRIAGRQLEGAVRTLQR